MPSHELRLLRVCEIALQTRSDRKVPYQFSRCFLPFLVSTHSAHLTCVFLRVLAPINDAIVDAYVVSNVRYIERAYDFLGVLDTSWTRVPLRETIVPECHHI